ncbi:hypothetical protein Thiowin_03841 [Thiorhodovibrio winogradskyi]|uniref:Uncharacterized protein n=1 Tax=Thiorhodovibrio winogradskyi TaxID=77007 RepID=A0ABZ0SF73_9GAMM
MQRRHWLAITGFGALIAAIVLLAAAKTLDTAPLPPVGWSLIAVFSLLPVLLTQAGKLLLASRRPRTRTGADSSPGDQG